MLAMNWSRSNSDIANPRVHSDNDFTAHLRQNVKENDTNRHLPSVQIVQISFPFSSSRFPMVILPSGYRILLLTWRDEATSSHLHDVFGLKRMLQPCDECGLRAATIGCTALPRAVVGTVLDLNIFLFFA